MSKNAEGWIRHNSKQQPVDDHVEVEIRTRGGDYEVCKASGFTWDATAENQIMAYRLHKPAEQGIYADDKDEYSEPVQVTYVDSDGPIQWRDRITEIDATTQALTAERADLVQKLASEGFALIWRAVELVEDVSLRNIKAGDTVVYVKESNGDFTNGRKYSVLSVDSSFAPYNVIDDEGDENCLSVEECAFQSRPSA